MEPHPSVAHGGGALSPAGGDGGYERPERWGNPPVVALPQAMGTVVEMGCSPHMRVTDPLNAHANPATTVVYLGATALRELCHT